jgi:hypothetical protein
VEESAETDCFERTITARERTRKTDDTANARPNHKMAPARKHIAFLPAHPFSDAALA